MKKKLQKSKNNRVIAGILGGIGEYFGLDENGITILRIVYAVLAIMSIGSLFLIYIILYFILPEAKKESTSQTTYYSNPNQYSTGRKIKEAEPIKSESKDSWSDF